MVIEYIENCLMFDHELRTGYYRVASLVVVNALRKLLIIMIQALIPFLICFWSVGFQGWFWYLFFVFVLNIFLYFR